MADATPASDAALPDGYRRPSHGRGALKPWQPGQSGNLSAARTDYRAVLELARDNSQHAMAKLIKLIDHRNPKVALVAAKEVLERAWGRVKEVDPNTGADPEAAARRSEMRAQVIAMLQALAVPEPLTVENAIPVPADPPESGDAGT
jgi:hypothetical protein